MNLFEVLYKGCSGFINIRAIPPTSSEFFPCNNLQWLPSVIAKNSKSNLYFGVSTRDGKGGGKDNVVDIPALWVDIDFKHTSKGRFDAVFPERFPVQPTAMVMSGGGYHIYWKLKKPSNRMDMEKIENILRRLAIYLSGDVAAAEIARVLRVPGSLNNKPEYEKPIPVTIKLIDPSREYSLLDFGFLPQLTTTTKSVNEIGWYLDSLKGVSDGERHVIAAKLAGRYIHKGLSENETCAILELWDEKNNPPLGQKDIEATVKSIKKTDGKKPKEIQTDAHHVTEIVKSLKQKIAEGVTGIDPCYNFLKQTVRYIQPGHLWIVGGYTSVGKSFFASDLLMRVMERTDDVGVALFSTEMSTSEYMVRFLSRKTCIKSYLIKENKVYSEYQKDALDEAYEFMCLQNLHMYDNLYRFEDIESEATKIKAEHGLDIIVIDYIQNLQGNGSIYERMSHLSPIILETAKKLNTCIIALSQVSNEAAKSDLDIIGYKGAGEIAAAADIGLWIERDKDDEKKLSMIVRKNRHGLRGQTVLKYDDDWTRLEEVPNG